MDQAVVGKVTTGSLVRVKLWTPEGKIVYSDEHRLIGASYPLAMDEQEVLRDNTVAAELSDLSARRTGSSATRAACSRSTCRSRPRAGTPCCSRPTPDTAR